MTTIQYIMEQGSEDWHKLHLGVPTASRFEDIMARKKDGEPTAARRKYLLEKVGEALTQESPETFGGNALARGKVMEAEGREVYAFMTGGSCTQVGFITRQMPFGIIGCSPDSLVADGLLEIKTKKADMQLEVLCAGKVPDEHVAQLQGALLVTGKPWIDLCCYWPRLPPFIRRVERDEKYLAILSVELEAFYEELNELVRRFQ